MNQCVLDKCQSPELCNNMSACDVRLYRDDVARYNAAKAKEKTTATYSSVYSYVPWLRGLAEKGGKGVVNNIDARCLGRIADQLEQYEKDNK